MSFHLGVTIADKSWCRFQDAPRSTEGCGGRVDMEAKLQHAGGELCPQQSAACGLFTESGKNFFSPAHSTLDRGVRVLP